MAFKILPIGAYVVSWLEPDYRTEGDNPAWLFERGFDTIVDAVECVASVSEFNPRLWLVDRTGPAVRFRLADFSTPAETLAAKQVLAAAGVFAA